MKSKILLVLMILLVISPQQGCKIRKSYQAEKRINSTLQLQKDSIERKFNQIQTELTSLRTSDSVGTSALERLRKYSESKNVNVESEIVNKPLEVKGEAYITSFTADWALDSAAVKNGKLVYYDVDNPTFRATIYKDSATKQMMFSVITKDKTIDVPVQKIRFQSQTRLQTSDSLNKTDMVQKRIKDSSQLHQDQQSGSISQSSINQQSNLQTSEKSNNRFLSKGFGGWQWAILGVVSLILVFVFLYLKRYL